MLAQVLLTNIKRYKITTIRNEHEALGMSTLRKFVYFSPEQVQIQNIFYFLILRWWWWWWWWWLKCLTFKLIIDFFHSFASFFCFFHLLFLFQMKQSFGFQSRPSDVVFVCGAKHRICLLVTEWQTVKYLKFDLNCAKFLFSLNQFQSFTTGEKDSSLKFLSFSRLSAIN